jgi:Zn-finger nucleic acid-binding protein
MNCPACDNKLTSLTAGKVTVDVCEGGCGGMWFDNFELKKLSDPGQIDAAALLQFDRDDLVLIDYEKRRRCPKCDIIMMRHFFSDRREVEVDSCPSCNGVWLDPGELTQIRREARERQDPNEAAQNYIKRVFGTGLGARRPQA